MQVLTLYVQFIMQLALGTDVTAMNVRFDCDVIQVMVDVVREETASLVHSLGDDNVVFVEWADEFTLDEKDKQNMSVHIFLPPGLRSCRT